MLCLIEGRGRAVGDQHVGGGEESCGNSGALDLTRRVVPRKEFSSIGRIMGGSARLRDGPRPVALLQIVELGADGVIGGEGVDALLRDVPDRALDQNVAGGLGGVGQSAGQGVGDHRFSIAGATDQRGDLPRGDTQIDFRQDGVCPAPGVDVHGKGT